MKRLLLLPLLALPLLFSGCDQEVPNEPASVVDDGVLLKGVTIQGAPATNMLKVKLSCARGVDGFISYTLYDADYVVVPNGVGVLVYCGDAPGTREFGSTPVSVGLTFFLNYGSPTCGPIGGGGDLPGRFKCPGSGKAAGTISFSYTK